MQDRYHEPDVAPADVEEFELDTTSSSAVEEVKSFDVARAQEETRSKIALHFTNFFLMLVAVVVLMPFVVNFVAPGTFGNALESAKELVTLLASVLAGPFGFIVGFYFKQSSDNNNG